MANPVAGGSMRRRAFIGLGALVMLACLLALLWERPAAAEERHVAELKELVTTFRGRSVDIYCADDFKEGRPSLANVRVVGSVTVLGKRLLRVRKAEGQHWLVDPARVVAFGVEGKK